MHANDTVHSPSAEEKARKAEIRRMWWLDRFPGNPLVHLLVFSRWFRLVVVAILLLPALGALALLRLWVTSPPGFTPVIKVSAVDLVQAWSLRRSAEQLAAAGKDKEAMRAWQMAFANNRGDLDVVRTCLRHTARAGAQDPLAMAQALTLVHWLLRLGQTNHTDVGLAARVCDQFELPDQAFRLLKLIPPDSLTPEDEEVHLKALFRTGRFKEFGARWEQRGATLDPRGPLGLYRAAYLAGWGTPEERTPSAERLKKAAMQPTQEVLACRLQLTVAAKLMDADGYAESLGQLERAQADRLAEHVTYWYLLASLGKSPRARELAEAFVPRITSAKDVAQLAKAYLSLDMAGRARSLLERCGAQYGDSDNEWALELWQTQARMLVETHDWLALEQLAVQLRALRRAGPALTGLSYLYEGRALLGQNSPDQAAVVLARIPQATLPGPTVALHVGRSLIDLGYPDLALQVLGRLEAALESDSAYWETRFEAVYGARQDSEALVRAARHGFELQPDNPRTMSNLAAALLVSRQEPAEALRLTLTVFNREPDSLVAQVNHACALNLNARFAEADQLLRRIGSGRLNEQQQAVYHLALAEALHGRRLYQEALKELERVQPRYLFPDQTRRLEQLQAEMRTGTGTGG